MAKKPTVPAASKPAAEKEVVAPAKRGRKPAAEKVAAPAPAKRGRKPAAEKDACC